MTAVLRRKFRSKVVGHGVERVDQLLANPGNWRIHPDHQQQALAGAIDEVGFIRSVTVNRVTGRVIDGHLRVALAARSGVEELPVEYVELTEDEEEKALLMLDPISMMAVADRDKLQELLRRFQSDDERVRELAGSIAATEGIYIHASPDDLRGHIADRDIELASSKLNGIGNQGMIELVCPSCGNHYYIAADELMQQINNP